MHQDRLYGERQLSEFIPKGTLYSRPEILLSAKQSALHGELVACMKKEGRALVDSVVTDWFLDGVRTSLRYQSKCKACSDAMVSFDRRVRFCSERCRGESNQQWHRERDRPSRAKSKTEKDCEHCATSFVPKRDDAKFCSSGCRVKHHRNAIKAGEDSARIATWVQRESYGINQGEVLSKVAKG